MSDSEKIRILLDQGLSAYGLGNVDEALQVWQSVLAMGPGNAKAMEYIRFVKESWGPKQVRQEGLGDPYRPDEGSGEIPMPDIVEQAQEDSGEIDISVDEPPENLGHRLPDLGIDTVNQTLNKQRRFPSFVHRGPTFVPLSTCIHNYGYV